MRIDEEIKLDFKDVLIRPKRSTLNSRRDVDLKRTFKFWHSNREWTGIPISASNMDTTGTFDMARSLSKYKMITCLHKFYSLDDFKNFFEDFNEPDYISYTMGIREDDFEKLNKIQKAGLENKFNFICLDVANAYLEMFVKKLELLRKSFSNHTIIAGNVATNEMTEEIMLRGADIVKIGIGPGSSCTTRKMTGIGYPQLSAIIECADSAHGLTNEKNNYRLIMADGGAVSPSCVSKAFCGELILL